MLTLLLVSISIGLVVSNPHCTYNDDCTHYDCGSEIPFCDHGGCGCIDSCKEGDCLKWLKGCQSYDSSMHDHYLKYCPHNSCHCPAPTTVSTTTHQMPTTSLKPGSCNDRTHCFSLFGDCITRDVHCVDKKCACLDTVHTTPVSRPVCSFASDCSAELSLCSQQHRHCLDGKCKCLAPATTTTVPPTTTASVCHTSSDCGTMQCNSGVALHCLDGACVCF